MDTGFDLQRLQRLLGGDDLAALRRRLRAGFERGGWAEEFTLTRLSPAERQALEGLLGRKAKAADSMRVQLTELNEAICRARLAADLRGALEALDGPLQDRKAQRLAHADAWASALSGVEEPRLLAWLFGQKEGGLLKRLTASDPDRAKAILTQVQRLLARLPAQGITRAQLAAQVFGDSHSLDAGRAVATIALQACSLQGSSDAVETVREQWARLGVAVNELASPALCLNLPVLEASGGRLCEAGEPYYLSLRQLLRSAPTWKVADCEVFVCENPDVVAVAADRLGAGCAPLICTEGMPSASQRSLLAQLAAQGARLRYHGDFDWAGLSIGNFVVREFGAVSWRFSTADYLAAAADACFELSADGRVEALWDATLADAMAKRGLGVHEEAVVETLLRDLEERMAGA